MAIKVETVTSDASQGLATLAVLLMESNFVLAEQFALSHAEKAKAVAGNVFIAGMQLACQHPEWVRAFMATHGGDVVKADKYDSFVREFPIEVQS